MKDSMQNNKNDVLKVPKEKGELYPIFPISNAVFFPKTIIPLHIFEPRYKRLIKDIKEFGNKRFVLTSLITNDNPIKTLTDTHGSLAEIIEEESLPDGRFNVVVLILERVKIIDYFREFDLFSNDYAIGEIISTPEEPIDSLSNEWLELRTNLYNEFKLHFERMTKRKLALTEKSIADSLTPEESINTVCNITVLEYGEKLSLLHINSLFERGKRILDIYRKLNIDQR